MPHPDPLISKLQTLQTQLPDLLGDQAPAVSQQLTQILQAAKQNPQDETITTRINLLLRHHPAAQTWLAQQTHTQQNPGQPAQTKPPAPQTSGITRGFAPVPGNMPPIPVAKYQCPNTSQTKRRQGPQIPICDCCTPPATCVPLTKNP